MIRARLRDHLPTIDRQYRRHVSGQGRAYRLRGGESQQAPGSEPRNGGRRNEGCSPTRAGRQTRSGTTPISTAAVTELREGGESAVFTTGGLDSSFAASTASTRRSGGRDGGGQEEEGASSHTEEEGDSYTEEEGTIEGIGSSILGEGGDRCCRSKRGSREGFSSCCTVAGTLQDAAAPVCAGHKEHSGSRHCTGDPREPEGRAIRGARGRRQLGEGGGGREGARGSRAGGACMALCASAECYA